VLLLLPQVKVVLPTGLQDVADDRPSVVVREFHEEDGAAPPALASFIYILKKPY
jgi:8-oxo-dGTP pyrophosphatase MutT (NUDIX family)